MRINMNSYVGTVQVQSELSQWTIRITHSAPLQIDFLPQIISFTDILKIFPPPPALYIYNKRFVPVIYLSCPRWGQIG